MSFVADSSDLGKIPSFLLPVIKDRKATVDVERQAQKITGNILFEGKTYLITLEYDKDIDGFSTKSLLEKEIAKICGAVTLFQPGNQISSTVTSKIEWGQSFWKRSFTDEKKQERTEEGSVSITQLLAEKVTECKDLNEYVQKINDHALSILSPQTNVKEESFDFKAKAKKTEKSEYKKKEDSKNFDKVLKDQETKIAEALIEKEAKSSLSHQYFRWMTYNEALNETSLFQKTHLLPDKDLTPDQKKFLKNLRDSRGAANHLILQELKNTQLQSIPGDGDCLYNSIGAHLKGETAQELREKAASYILQHPEEFIDKIAGSFSPDSHDQMTINFQQEYVKKIGPLPEKDFVNAYCQFVKMAGTYGQDVEIYALSKALERPIICNNNDNLSYYDGGKGEPIPIRFNGINHYEAYVSKRSHVLEEDRVPVPFSGDISTLKKIEQKNYRIETDLKVVQHKLKKELSIASKNIQEPINNSANRKGVPRGLNKQIETRYPRMVSGMAYAQGLRAEMEDEYICERFTFQAGGKELTCDMWGVFDGHGGSEAAAHARAHIVECLKKRLEQYAKNGLSDLAIWNALKIGLVDLSLTLKNPESGCTANVCLKIGDALWTANVGDSRALLVYPDGKLQVLSDDARLEKERFRKQVLARGGKIISSDGVDKINGRLSVAKSLCDHKYKGVLNPRPKITKIDHVPKGTILVQACDGIFDALSSETVKKSVIASKDAICANIAENLIKQAYAHGSMDNMTVSITKL